MAATTSAQLASDYQAYLTAKQNLASAQATLANAQATVQTAEQNVVAARAQLITDIEAT